MTKEEVADEDYEGESLVDRPPLAESYIPDGESLEEGLNGDKVVIGEEVRDKEGELTEKEVTEEDYEGESIDDRPPLRVPADDQRYRCEEGEEERGDGPVTVLQYHTQARHIQN